MPVPDENALCPVLNENVCCSRMRRRLTAVLLYSRVRTAGLKIYTSWYNTKHCENESGDCIYPGRLYVSYHEVYADQVKVFEFKNKISELDIS